MESEITIKKQDLENWIKQQMRTYLDILIDPKNNLYRRFESLIVFGILNQLRLEAKLDHPTISPELYRAVYDLYPIIRHYIQLSLQKDFNPFKKIDELVIKQKTGRVYHE